MLISDVDTVRSWQGRAMVDRDGDRIGSIEDIYADDQSGEPEWALVKTGLFGTKSSFVPIVQASQRDGDVQVPYDKQLVKDAPRIEADQHLIRGRRAAVVAPLRPGLRRRPGGQGAPATARDR
jgi:sporulation protein YlmC with PRC-barrel domain